MASLGLSAELAQKLTRDIKRRCGRLGYALVALKVLAQARPFRATITSETETVRVRTLQIAVGNGRFYGGGNAVEKDAAIDDQHLDLYSLELERAWKLALMARSFRYGEHGAWEEVRAIRAKEFDIRTRRPRPVNADGEIVTQTPAHFSIRPAAVTVFAPAGQRIGPSASDVVLKPAGSSDAVAGRSGTASSMSAAADADIVQGRLVEGADLAHGPADLDLMGMSDREEAP